MADIDIIISFSERIIKRFDNRCEYITKKMTRFRKTCHFVLLLVLLRSLTAIRKIQSQIQLWIPSVVQKIRHRT